MKAMIGSVWANLRGPIGRRWCQWMGHGAIVLLVGVFLLPALRRNPESVHAYFAGVPAPLRAIAILATTTAVACFLFRLLGPRLTHIRSRIAWRHPPLWSAWVAAGAILCALDLTVGVGPADYTPSVRDWAMYGAGSVLLAAVARQLTQPPERQISEVTPTVTTSIDDLVGNWPTFENWLRSERPADDDLIGNRRVARRLAEYLNTRGGTVGLVGPFGSGKSSVVAWLKDEVIRSRRPGQPVVWFAEQSCWGFEDSGSAVQQILARALEAVGREADCFSLRSLPETYRKTFAAGGDWLRTLADLALGSSDPHEQFRQLADVLEATDARLVVVVEDLDRTPTGRFDRQEVQALLQRLRGVSNRISFVLASGQTQARDIDFAKLCDHIEILRDFDATRVTALISAVRNRCLDQSAFPHVPAVSLDQSRWNASALWSLSGCDIVTLPESAARLLRTPRALKHALRRTYRAWEVLHGEVDFDHLLAVNVLRHGAPEAFDFLLRHWDQLHVAPRSEALRDTLPRVRDRLTAEWQIVSGRADWDTRAAMALLTEVLPSLGEYLGTQRGTRECNPAQGIGHRRYWLRVVSEEIDLDEVRDQVILRDIADWRESRDATSPLLDGLRFGGDYVGVWEHFAHRTFGTDPSLVLVLADQVFERCRNQRGARTLGWDGLPNPDRPVLPETAFTAIWRYANRNVTHDDVSRDWLENQVRLAMPASLSLVNDLYYWASHRLGILAAGDRAVIRRVVCQLAREQLLTADDLLRVIHPGTVYCVYQLVFPPDADDGPSENRGLPGWAWLGPVLLESLRAHPARFAAEIGHLVAVSQHTSPGVRTYELDRALLAGFFTDSADEVVVLLASAREHFTGEDRQFLDQLARSADSYNEGSED